MRMLFGFEVETGVSNAYARHIDVGFYHGGKKLTENWTAENDASLRSTKPNMSMVEFVSKPIKKVAVRDALLELKAKIDPAVALDAPYTLDLNKSCGAHIHFSWVCNVKKRTIKHNKLYGFLPVENMKEIRQHAFKRIKAEFGQPTFVLFREKYFRFHAKRMKGEVVNNIDRYREFICTPHKGAEWRSFNLTGTKTWNDIIKYYEIATEALEKVILTEFRRKKMFVIWKTIELPKKDVQFRRRGIYEESKTFEIEMVKVNKIENKEVIINV